MKHLRNKLLLTAGIIQSIETKFSNFKLRRKRLIPTEYNNNRNKNKLILLIYSAKSTSI